MPASDAEPHVTRAPTLTPSRMALCGAGYPAAEPGIRFRVRLVSRHPERVGSRDPRDRANLERVPAGVNDAASVATAVADSFGIVNAVSLYVEKHGQTFRSS